MKLAILAEGQFARNTAKTAIGVLRYAPYTVVAIVDSTRAGTDAAEHVGLGKDVPVVATVDEAQALGAEALLIGTAAAGGRIADTYRPHLARALERGVTVWNGLHERVLSDPALAAAARRGSATVRELREPPPDLPIGGHRIRRADSIVVLTVGTGAAEQMVCEAAEKADYVIVEGQGSLTHPGFSGVTLGLLHGAAPDLMVLCHDENRMAMKGYEREGLPVRSLRECIAIYEDAASWRRPPGYPRAAVVAVALNTAGWDDENARRHIDGAAYATK